MNDFKLGQEFVTRVTSDPDALDVSANGPPPPMPTKEDEWLAKYAARMMEAGLDADDAFMFARMGDNDYDSDPVEAAESEMECWTDDGDGP